jgi:hypothetical protein
MKTKKWLFLFISILVSMACCLQSCDKNNDPDPEPEQPIIDPDEGAISVQFANKTISLPIASFPAIDVSTTEITLIEGPYQAKLNEVQFNGDEFATGKILPEGGKITIEQKGEVLVAFEPKTGGAGTKIKITGIGSTSALTTPEGVGKGIYTLKIPEGATDGDGYLKGYTVYSGGNINNKIKSLELEGGVAYLLRRDHLAGAKDIEGWATNPPSLTNGFDADNSQAISLYLASESTKPVDQQIPVVSATPLPSSGTIPFVIHRVDKEEGDGRNYYVQGNGDMTCMFKIGNGVRPNDYTFEGQGVPAEHSNQDYFARAYYPQIQFQLYVCDHKTDLVETDLASPETCAAFVSNNGIDPALNYVILKVLNPERVNTQEELVFIWQRKETPENAGSMIRLEGMDYDAQNNVFVLKAGLTIRTSPY